MFENTFQYEIKSIYTLKTAKSHRRNVNNIYVRLCFIQLKYFHCTKTTSCHEKVHSTFSRLFLQSNALPTELFRLTWIVLQLGAFISIELLDQ